MQEVRELNYGRLMQKAMRTLLAEVLGIVAEDGLPGDHHLYISFDTRHPGVDIAEWLHKTYPEEMTIVIQHEYWDLAVMGDRFQITLTFRDVPETLVVPLDAVTTFVDPSVEFGLKFDAHDSEEETGDLPDGDAVTEVEKPAETEEEPEDKTSGSAEVVSLDQFRKP